MNDDITMPDITTILRSLGDFLMFQDGSLQFCTLQFLALFVVFFAGYLLIGQKRRTLMIAYVVVFNLFFAYKVNGLLMLLMPLTTILSWLLTRSIRQADTPRWRTIWLVAVIVTDLLPLLYFKYTNFFIGTVSALLQTNFPMLDIVLPVGISFFTFQAISYSVDVYRNRFKEDVTLLEYSFFMTFFPLLFAGPITRAGTLLTQLRDKHHLVLQRSVYAGMWLITIGMLKKGLVADYISEYNNWIFEDPMAYSGFENLVAVLSYTLQIYLDFSGYSDISIGLAALMGFRLRDNFNFPYQSLNVTEFWHRWHISLSTWIRDYLYIPLGGNRVGMARRNWNLFITMVIAGFWHGSSWMFVIWGAIHGAALVFHKLMKPVLERIPDNRFVRIVSCALTFLFVAVAWVFFRANSLPTVMNIFTRIATDFSWDYAMPFFSARTLLSLLLIVSYAMLFIHDRTYRLLERMFIESPWLMKLILLVCTIQLLINFSTGNIQPFIYSQF